MRHQRPLSQLQIQDLRPGVLTVDFDPNETKRVWVCPKRKFVRFFFAGERAWLAALDDYQGQFEQSSLTLRAG
jgi:hypothetical protein